jgi:hypothetical protein
MLCGIEAARQPLVSVSLIETRNELFWLGGCSMLWRAY